MKPSRFSYYAPETLAEAIDLLQEYGDEAKILAGGQSLVPMMNMRLARPSVLVDICRIEELGEVSADGALTIGATTRQLTVRRSVEVGRFAPIVPQVMPFVGHIATQSRGTFGGIAAHADPAAEIPAVLLLLEAEFIVEGVNGERTIQAEDFFSTYFTTALAESEILTGIRLSKVKHGARSAFLEVARRHGDFSIVGVAVLAEIRGDEVVEWARLALCGIGERPARAKEAEEFLRGARLDPESAFEAGRLVADQLDPPSDLHASSRYRKEVAAALVRRVLSELRRATPAES